MEADLSRFHQLRLQDRYLPDRRRRLTVRQIAVRVRWLPGESACARLERTGPVWVPADFMLDDLRRWVAVAGGFKDPGPHPMGPFAEQIAAQASARRAEQDLQIAAAKTRRDERLARLAARDERGS